MNTKRGDNETQRRRGCEPQGYQRMGAVHPRTCPKERKAEGAEQPIPKVDDG